MTARHRFAFWPAVCGGGTGGSAGGRRPTGRPLSYAENSPLAGDATREADAREPPSSTRSGRSPAMPGRSTPHRDAARRGARGQSSPSTVTGHGREWRPARFRLRETAAERDASAADWRRPSRVGLRSIPMTFAPTAARRASPDTLGRRRLAGGLSIAPCRTPENGINCRELGSATNVQCTAHDCRART